MHIVPGFVPGIVKDRSDPLAQGRVRVLIPDLVEPISPWWVKPAAWPGSGGAGLGAQYPAPALDAQVYVVFEMGRCGEPETSAVYFTGMYGMEGGVSVCPTAVTSAATAEAARERACIWEDENFAVYITNEEGDKKLTMQTKQGSYIEIDAAAGDDGKSEYIAIDARTKMIIRSSGLIDISGSVVQIQGRRVMKRGESSGSSRGTI